MRVLTARMVEDGCTTSGAEEEAKDGLDRVPAEDG
jgi:hypothetical protein